jgi:hypothetical protein
LLALVDADYKFSIIDVGSYGKNSEGGILEYSSLGKGLLNNRNTLNLPEDASIVSGEGTMPFVIVGDEAFRLTRNIMKPYPRRDLTQDKRRFNYRLSAARQMVECTFGALVSKFRIFETPIGVNPDMTDDIIKVACVIHNMIRTVDKEELETCSNTSLTVGAFEPLREPGGTPNQSTKEAREIRNAFKDYFNGIGATDTQD